MLSNPSVTELSMVMDSRTQLPGGTQTTPCYVSGPFADLMTESGIGTQALFGQRFEVIESQEFQLRGALLSILPGVDRVDYIGTLPKFALSSGTLNPTYVVSAVSAAVFMEANIKSSLIGSFPRNAVMEGVIENGFLKLPNDGFIHSRHIRSLSDQVDRPFTEFALDMLNLPYIWGGTGRIGVDCSGLIQSALAATRVDAPRDADQQEAQLGQPIDFADRAAGDLLFWSGHVGIIIEGDHILHANAHHMCVAMEPVEYAVSRIGPVRTVKRL